MSGYKTAGWPLGLRSLKTFQAQEIAMHIMKLSLLAISALSAGIHTEKCREYSASRWVGTDPPTVEQCQSLYEWLNKTDVDHVPAINVTFDSGQLQYNHDNCSWLLWALEQPFELTLKDLIHLIPDAVRDHAAVPLLANDTQKRLECDSAIQCNGSALAWAISSTEPPLPPDDLHSPLAANCKDLYDYLINTVDPEQPEIDINPEFGRYTYDQSNCTISFWSEYRNFALSMKQQAHVITDAIKKFAVRPEGSSQFRIEASGFITCEDEEGGRLGWKIPPLCWNAITDECPEQDQRITVSVELRDEKTRSKRRLRKGG
ncbi:hypothetical protein QBC44DRAFT_374903 [Cladorrhinum sp. PSN332]|nr:hypothetical protein QBC44DRAFT_374903 [Cladorrhinum sp. PSN332]